MSSKRNYYNILGVIPAAEEFIIRAAYRALAQRFHPDRQPSNGLESASDKMVEINEAYSVLSDPSRRKQYDLSIRSNGVGSEFQNESDDFTDDPLKADWDFAVKFHPGLEAFNARLCFLSTRLAYTFRASLLESKRYKEGATLAAVFEESFFKQYFGTNPKILEFARELIFSEKSEIAKMLNRAIEVLGNDCNAGDVIKTIKADFPQHFPVQKSSPLPAHVVDVLRSGGLM